MVADIDDRTLSMTPFVPFIALIGNAVSTSSKTEMALLEDALLVMRPIVVESPYVRCVVRECEVLFRIAADFLA